MIVVIDSGIWVSAFQFGGIPLAAVRAAFVKHQIAICDQIIQEVEAVLSRKFEWTSKDVHQVLAAYLIDAVSVTVTGKVVGVCRDHKDDMVFECALLANAAMIVSGDQDILAIQFYEGISTVTAREFAAGI